MSWLCVNAWLFIALLGISGSVYVKFVALMWVAAQAYLSRPWQQVMIAYLGRGLWRLASLGDQPLVLDSRTRYTASWIDLCLRQRHGAIRRIPVFATKANGDVWRVLQIVVRDALK